MEKHTLITTDGKKLLLDDEQLRNVRNTLSKNFVIYEDKYQGKSITRYINVDCIKTIIEYNE